MKDTVGLTGLQLSILEVLWERGEATTQDVWAHVTRARPLALTTVATLMSRLERKKVLEHRRRPEVRAHAPPAGFSAIR